MNIQTERLENHTARFTVELDIEQLERAKQTAARKLAQRVSIPGFRKGKAPYRVLVNYLGEAAILEDAIEILGKEVYKEALDQSGLEPYGPGEIEDFKADPQPVFTFVVPLQPEVHLGDYRSVRLDFSVPAVKDEEVNQYMQMLQQQHALVEESRQPVAMGNQVTIDLHAELVDETAEAGEVTTDPHAHDPHRSDENVILHQHDTVIMLREGDDMDEPAPGFQQALLGANVGEERVFDLTYPDTDDYDEEIRGKRARFYVTVKKIETVTLPTLNDDFAARVTQDEEKPLTLLELRMRVRENLQKAAEQRAKTDYARRVLDMMVEGAKIAFPEALVEDELDRHLRRFDSDLRQRGLTLNDFLRISGKSLDDVRADFRDTVVNNLKRGLVLREVLRAEAIQVSDEAVSEEVDRILAQFGESAEGLRSLFDTPQMRGSIENDLLEQRVLDRIVMIARGELPEEAQAAGVSEAEPNAEIESTPESEA